MESSLKEISIVLKIDCKRKASKTKKSIIKLVMPKKWKKS
jgi:hypothetical protein